MTTNTQPATKEQTSYRMSTRNSSEPPVKLADATADAAESFRAYAAERPDVVAMWAFGIGFVLGWRLKPW